MKPNKHSFWPAALALLLIVVSCQKDLLQDDAPVLDSFPLKTGSFNGYERSYVTFEEFKAEVQDYALFQLYEDRFESASENPGDFLRFISKEQIVKFSNDSVTTYTLHAVTALQQEDYGSFSNILFILNGDSLSAGLINYTPTPEWIHTLLLAGTKDLYEGTIDFIDHDGRSIVAGDMMNGDFYQTKGLDCDVIVLPEFTDCYGPSCPCTDGNGFWSSIEIIWCNPLPSSSGSSGQESYDWPPGNSTGGGSGTSRPVNPFLPTDPVDPPIHYNLLLIPTLNDLLDTPLTQEQIYWIFESTENYLFAMEALDALQNGGEVDWDEQIIYNLPNCLSEIVDVLLNSQNGKFSQVIQQFSGNNPVPNNYNWIINQDIASSGNPATASTDPTVSNGTVTTRIFTNNVINATDLSMARTMIHEAFHAYLVFVYRYQNIDKNYAYLINQFANQYNNNANDIHHALFIQTNIISEIAIALNEYGSSKGYNLSMSYYNDMAWGGLTHVRDPANPNNFILNPAFTQANPNVIDQERILNRLEAELTNQNINGVPPQGNQACP